MKQKVFYTELAYVLGLVIMAFAAAFTEKADFGMSMVVAPAYLLHLKVSETLPFFSFGMAEYMLQLVILLAMMLVLRRVKLSWLFSFVTAVLYGLALDLFMLLAGSVPTHTFLFRGLWFVLGMVLCSLGVAFFFRTYLAPEVYELFVKELAVKFHADMGKVKWIYDICSCVFAVVLSFCFFGFGQFQGIYWGTAVCALLNGRIIMFFGKWMDRRLAFKDLLPIRKFFEVGQHS